jgi:hypothetical protein
MTHHTFDPPIIVAAGVVAKTQTSYEVFKGAAGEFVFWVSFITALVLVARLVARFVKSKRQGEPFKF